MVDDADPSGGFSDVDPTGGFSAAPPQPQPAAKVRPNAYDLPSGEDDQYTNPLTAAKSAWQDNPIDSTGLTAQQKADIQKANLPRVVQAGVGAVDAAGNVVGNTFESVNRMIGATAGYWAQKFGMSPTHAQKLARDMYGMAGAAGMVGGLEPHGGAAAAGEARPNAAEAARPVEPEPSYAPKAPQPDPTGGFSPVEPRPVAPQKPAVAVTERAPDGTEVKSAVGTQETAPEQVLALDATKSPDSTVSVEPPQKVLAERAAQEPSIASAPEIPSPPLQSQEPSFRTGPAQIANEHAAEVSRLEAEGTADAAARSGLANEGEGGGEGIPPEGPGEVGGPEDYVPKDNIPEWLTQREDELFRLMNTNKVDSLQAIQMLKTIPKDSPLRDGALMTKIARSEEEKMQFPNESKNPDYALTPEEQAIKEREIDPLRRAANDVYMRLLAQNLLPEALPKDPGMEGYVHRIAKGKGSVYDAGEGPVEDTNPISGRGLGRKASSQFERNPNLMVVSEDGQTKKFYNGTEIKAGDGFSKDGVNYRVRPATAAEIEAHTPVRYHMNAFTNTLDNLLSLRRVERNVNYLNWLKNDPVYKENVARPIDGDKVPPDWRETAVPQLRGDFMNPRMANMFDDFYNTGVSKSDLLNAYRKINRFTIRTIFLNPIAAFYGHGRNVFGHWQVGRGTMNFDPRTYPKSLANLGRAWNEVASMGPIYKRLMLEGNALQLAGMYTRDFHNIAVSIAKGEFEKNPKTWGEIARIAGTTPAAIYNGLSDISSKGLWFGSDVLMVQRVLDLMDQKNLGIRDAIREAEKEIPNYRVPTEAWDGPGGRAFAELMKNNDVTMFGRYHYGILKAYAATVKDAAPIGKDVIPKGPKYEQLEQPLISGGASSIAKVNDNPNGAPPGTTIPRSKTARAINGAGQLLAAYVIFKMLYPQEDKIWQHILKAVGKNAAGKDKSQLGFWGRQSKAFGDVAAHASMRRAGPFTLPSAITSWWSKSYKHPKTSDDFKNLYNAFDGLIGLPPTAQIANSIYYSNRDPVSGKHVWNPYGGPEEIGKSVLGAAASMNSLGQQGEAAISGRKTMEQNALNWFGVNAPTNQQFNLRRKYARMDAQADSKAANKKSGKFWRDVKKLFSSEDK